MIEVRRAGPDDAGVLGEVHTAAWEAVYAPFFEPDFVARSVQARLGRWHERINEGEGTILVAVLDGRPMALSYFVPSSSRLGLAEIYSFYGHPAGWGSGVAAVLMTETLGHLRNHGFTRLHLWTARDTPRSRRFYSKCGFTESGATRVHDFGDGHLLDQVEYERAC